MILTVCSFCSFLLTLIEILTVSTNAFVDCFCFGPHTIGILTAIVWLASNLAMLAHFPCFVYGCDDEVLMMNDFLISNSYEIVSVFWNSQLWHLCNLFRPIYTEIVFLIYFILLTLKTHIILIGLKFREFCLITFCNFKPKYKIKDPFVNFYESNCIDQI